MRTRGTTTQRGYGSDHQREREFRLERYRPGDRCAHGGEQMWWWPLSVARRYLHLPHNAARTGYLPGLSCAKHNCEDGARRKNRKQRSRLVHARRLMQPRPSRNW